MDYFMDVTINGDIEKYLNELDKNTLFIYSPTSIEKINFKNKIVKSINWHDITKNIEKLDIIVKENNNIEKIVTFGGGSTIDIGKYIAHKLNVKFVCIPSMLSTNSYATNKVALIHKGMKITLNAKMPNLIIFDEKIIKISQIENLYGLADVLSIYTALYDWKLSSKDKNEEIDKKIYNMSLKLLNDVMKFIFENTFEEIIKDTPKLFEYIGQSGYITNLYGTGRPESGSEHIFAKKLESMIDIPHGISVSIGIIMMTIAQERNTKKIMSAINKIQVLEKKEIYGINKSIIKECTENLRPREGRYTIIDKMFNNIIFVNKILERFYDKKVI